jgi:CarD family transcriptional regulator
MEQAIATLQGKARVRRTMWSRRAQEYETKIKSGDPVSIAEVVRDLHRRTNQSEQSYSERQMYQAALERLAREFAAIEKIDQEAAATKLEDLMDAA